MRRKIVLILLGIVATMIGALFGATPASAHNTFVDSTPRDGEVLVSAPTTWSVTFAKSVPLESASGSIIDGSGARITLPPPTHGTSDRIIVFGLPSGLNGGISARWRLVSVDGHVISGRVAFTVRSESGIAVPPSTGPESGAVDDPTRVPDPIRAGLRFANFVAVALLGGLLFIEFDIASGALMTRRGRKLASWAAGVLAAVPAAQFLIFADDIGGGQKSLFSATPDALSMTAGGMLFVRFIAGSVLAWLAITAGRTPDALRSMYVPVGVTAFTYLVSLAYVGHSRSQAAPWLGVPLDVAHSAAMAIWLGGLVVLLVSVVPFVDTNGALTAFSRFSYVAQRAVAVIAVTGVVQALRLHGNPVNLISSTHGAILAGKVVLVALMIRLAARNRSILDKGRKAALTNDDRSRDLLVRATTSEIAFGVGVLGVTAVLVAVTPA
jgi:copper transport protein